jgi:hypothetical protein
MTYSQTGFVIRNVTSTTACNWQLTQLGLNALKTALSNGQFTEMGISATLQELLMEEDQDIQAKTHVTSMHQQITL